MIPVERALEVVLGHAAPLASEEVALPEALGRVLAEDVASDLDMPPFDRSAMDGYALRAEDLAVLPAVLAVVGQVRAGGTPERAVRASEAVEIMTGAPVPEGATAVQPVEKTRRLDAGRVSIDAPVAPGAHIARRGSEVCRGQRVLEGGERLGPAALAVLAACGRSRVRVGRRPRLTLLVTGDELVPVAAVPGPGQIRNSNEFALAAQARLAGAEVRSLGVVPDVPERIAAALAQGLEADVLVASGGVSAGAFDLVEPGLARLGVEVLFDKVAIKPGAPLVFGRRGATLVFGLPGNPVSAQVTFELFVRAALLRMQGARRAARPLLEAELTAAVQNRSGRKNHVPVVLRPAAGRLLADPLPSKGSADVFAHARANALAILEAEQQSASAGQRVPVLPLPSFLDSDGEAA
jgi:molybdenum cofactor synthesis domain-containing protein